MRNKLSNFLLFTFIFSFSSGTNAYAQRARSRRPPIRAAVTVTSENAAKPKLLTPEEQRRQDAFSTVWQTINLNYFDKTFSGLDWNKIREEFQPRVTAAKTDAEVHRLLAEMVNRLGTSHFAIIPPEFLKTVQQAKAEARARERELSGAKDSGRPPDEKNGNNDPLIEDPDATFGIGIDLKLIEDRFVISRVDKQSTASIAGLRPGYILDKINGVSLTDLVNRMLISFPDAHNLRSHLPLQIVAGILNGEQDTTVFLTCLDENDQPHEYKVPRIALNGDSVSIGKRLPRQFLQYQAVSLDDEIGYVKFNLFAIPVIGKFCDSLTEFAYKKAIIIDLRGNVGGVLGTLIGLTGMMSEKAIKIGTTRYRSGSEPLMAEPKKKRFNGQLVFLVDHESVSAAEIFAASMQDNHRAIIVGDHTAGEALPSVSATLATGAVLVYPIANFTTPNGRSLEGTGVEPDYLVKLERKALLNGKDTQLDKAVSLLRSGVELPKPTNGGNLEGIRGNAADPSPPPPPPKRAPGRDDTPRVLLPPATAKAPGIRRLGVSAAPVNPLAIVIPTVPKKDPAALKIINDFAEKIGGRAELAKINSYGVSGHGVISFRGVDTDMDVRAWRQRPDKFTMIMNSPALGEMREIYNGSEFYLQTDFGMDTHLNIGAELNRMQLFSAIFDVLDPALFTSLTFEGSFDMDGRKVNAVTAKTEKGAAYGIAFDQETKLLVRYTPPGSLVAFGDYRKVGNFLLPFQINLDPMMRFRLDSVDINAQIDPANFERMEKCFDKEK